MTWVLRVSEELASAPVVGQHQVERDIHAPIAAPGAVQVTTLDKSC